MAVVLQIALNGILSAALYALIAGGLSFLYATTRIFHLAHGVTVTSAGYAFWWMWQSLGWHPALAALFALAVAAAVSFLMNEFAYEPLRRRGTKGLGYLIATLALLMLGTGVIQLLFGAAPKTFQLAPRVFEFGGVTITFIQAFIILVSTILLAAFYWLIRFTRFGKAMRATADNETVAEVLGVNTRNIRRLAFLLAGFLAAAAGVFFGMEFSLDPNRGVILAVFGFAATVIGGAGSVAGAIAGSTLIGLVEQGVVWFWGAGWRNAAVFLLLFVFLLVKPRGIMRAGLRRDAL